MEAITVDKTHIEKRVRDWKKRIKDLYSTIKEWLDESDYLIKPGSKLPMYEEMMAKYHIPPTEVDTADIYKSGKIIFTLKPKGLWIIGANGRIDILSIKGSYFLIDQAEKFKTPHWKLFINGDKKNGTDLNKNTLLKLLQ